MPLSKYQDLTVQGKAYDEAYSDHCNSTASDEGGFCAQIILSFCLSANILIEGQIVDAAIMPVAPHAAVIPAKYYHTGTYHLPELRGKRGNPWGCASTLN